MASEQQKRDELIRFLDEKAFDPVLHATESQYSDKKKKEKLADVKRSTENEKRRFHEKYKTARDVKDNYMSDLHSQVGKKKSDELADLNLPYMGQFHDEFMKLCDRLQV